METFFAAVQKACLPGVWSKGVALSRDETLLADVIKDDEIIIRVILKSRPVGYKVSLWPQDEDWHCNCGDRNDLCAHIAAAVISLRAGKLKTASEAPKNTVQLSYRLIRFQGTLKLERWLIHGTQEKLLQETLVSLAGGIQSGRIALPPLAATREDYSIDQILGVTPNPIPNSAQWLRLLPLLKEYSLLTLDGTAIQISTQPIGLKVVVTEENQGFRIRAVRDVEIQESFQAGLACIGNTLRPLTEPDFTANERSLLTSEKNAEKSEEGRWFSSRDLPMLLSEILPNLETKVSVDLQISRLPEVQKIPPRIELRLNRESTESLVVLPVLVYGNPAIAEIHDDRLELLNRDQIPERDRNAERQWIRKLRSELHLAPDQWIRLQGETAVQFVEKIRDWDHIGEGQTAFGKSNAPLTPRLNITADSFDLWFESGSLPGGQPERVDAVQVFQAWKDQKSLVPLLSGSGWAPLPHDWLKRFGKRIEAMWAAKQSGKKIPAYQLPELSKISLDSGGELAPVVAETLKFLKQPQEIPEAKLPEGIRADLRSYQRTGVNWLSYLREAGMGALLADDMGLGKTLQTLCVLKDKTLIIMPTSVLHNWTDQLERFRPELKVSTYYGAGRRLDPKADVVLTTYAILRLDLEKLAAFHWGTIVLDEAQTIKNPESQAARAVHQLTADFRIALSGTPVENRLEDFWSQFHFLNPGLLGSRQEFLERFGNTISQGNANAAKELRDLIRPFILRRLKKDVAPELPPRTDTILSCELGTDERATYDAILASTRKEILEQLDAGGSVFAALEALLRLRQACCHPSLVPGQKAASSSKTDLLLEALDECILEGHRSLVFSQWTSYLDLIETELKSRGIAYLRLDGTTQNRDEMVREFQSDQGPPVMLLSLKAGGVGITLTAADHVYLMDPWWNPAVENQAADRVHRIGQTRSVFVHRLVAENTIEERILVLQKRKQRLADAVLDDAPGDALERLSLTRDDLIELLN